MPFANLKHRYNSKNQRVWYVDYETASNKRSDFTIGKCDKREAEKIASRIQAIVLEGGDPQELKRKGTRKLSDLIDDYLKYCEITQRPKTIEMKKLAYNRLTEHLGNPFLDNLKPNSIESWIKSMQDDLSKTSISMYFRSVKVMLNWGLKRGYLKEDIIMNGLVKDVKQPDADPQNYFTKEDIHEILSSINHNKPFWKIVFLAFETGGRLSELVLLEWDDIDWDNMRILFRGKNTKTKARRFVPLRESAVQEISNWKRGEGRIFNWSDHNTPSKSFSRLLDKLDFRTTKTGTWSFHTIRHSFASHLLMNGADIFAVSRLLGHSSVKVTENHYSHLIPDKFQSVLERLSY
jgi:integrase/recombinase XerD